MLQISTETPLTFPFLFETGEPEPPDTGDQPPPTGIKPPTNQQQSNVGDSGIKPPTATDAEPPDTADGDPPPPGGGNS